PQLYPLVFYLRFQCINALYQQLWLFFRLFPSETFECIESTRRALKAWKPIQEIKLETLQEMSEVINRLYSVLENCLQQCSELDSSISFEDYRKALNRYKDDFGRLNDDAFLTTSLKEPVDTFSQKHMTIPFDLFRAIQRYVFLESWFRALDQFQAEEEQTFAYSRRVQELFLNRETFYRFSYLPLHRILVVDRLLQLLESSDLTESPTDLSSFLKARSEELVSFIDEKEFAISNSGRWYNNLGAGFISLSSKVSDLSIFREVLDLQFPELPNWLKLSFSGGSAAFFWVMQCWLGMPVLRNLAIELGTRWAQETLSSSLMGDICEDCGVSRDTAFNYLEPVAHGAIDFGSQCLSYYSYFSSLTLSMMEYALLTLLLSKGIHKVVGKMHRSIHESRPLASNRLLQTVLYLSTVLTSPKISPWLLSKFLKGRSEPNEDQVIFPWLEDGVLHPHGSKPR
ncbi:MAG: hypothetical protein ABIH77_06205, partial [Pseudomonadota bacterium]